MTPSIRQADSFPEEARPSMLPFDPADLTSLRVSPAQFARMCGVSRTAVSDWIKQGKVALGPDGKLDPAKAAREILARTDPARMRARVFKDALAGRDELLARIRMAERKLSDFHVEHQSALAAALEAAQFQFSDDQALRLAALQDEIVARFEELDVARIAGELPDRLESMVGAIFYPESCAQAEVAAAKESQPTNREEQ